MSDKPKLTKSDTKKKSWKREVALGMILFWSYMTYIIFFVLKPASVLEYSSMYNTVTSVLIPASMTAFFAEGFQAFKEGVKKRTWKREVAGAILAGWCVLTWHLFRNTQPDAIAFYTPIHSNMTMFIVPSTLAIFLADSFQKHRTRVKLQDEVTDVTVEYDRQSGEGPSWENNTPDTTFPTEPSFAPVEHPTASTPTPEVAPTSIAVRTPPAFK